MSFPDMPSPVPPSKRTRYTECMNFSKWGRPPAPNRIEGKVTFMQVDIDYTTDTPHPAFSGLTKIDTKVPVLRVFGVTEQGHSVLAYIHGFEPYFYVECPSEELAANPKPFQDALEEQLKIAGSRDRVAQHVLKVEAVKRSSLMGWAGSNEHINFLRVVVAVPTLVSASRRVLEGGFGLPGGGRFGPATTFETNIPFPLRFMVDRDLVGGGWLSADNFQRREPGSKLSSCQLELDVHFESVLPVAHDPIAPLRILSFDIECFNPEGKGFPTADKCPVIQIAAYLKEQGSDEPVMSAVWNLNTCNDIAGSEVFTFEQEKDLLISFRNFFAHVDADIITGYNIANFDWPYLLDRAEALGISGDFSKLGRIMMNRTRKKVNEIQGREVVEVEIDGRVIFDMFSVIKKEQKLSSYSLNAVSAEFLGQQKEDVHYSMMGELFTKSAETRRRLAVYCLKDAYLPILLMEKLLCMYNYIEMARVTGTPINFLLNRGQMIKVTSQLLRKARQMDYIMPALTSKGSDDKFEGATVLDPITGYYAKPIATLDFASLYPSIMMAHNICYCTLVRPEQVQSMDPEQLTKAPSTGSTFVKQTVRRGLLPMILEEILAARKKAKKAMNEATDPLTKSVLNGRQLALKVSANSVYGFTGATSGILPCLEISASITAFGRTMIDHTKAMVEAKYTIQNGYEHDAQVIYGDTDSVMVKFGTDSVAESMRLGQEAADLVSTTFLKPIKLEFEKVYCPYLLMNKKRYAGLYWTNPDHYDKLDAKGIETVRRDNCGLVRHLVERSLHILLIDKSIGGAIEYIKQAISDLLLNKIDLSLLVITKSLGKGATAADYSAKQAHVELAERMRKRDPASAPGSGDRVPYVIISGNKGLKAYEKSEDPLFALENNLTIDAGYYIENQLTLPLLRIFGPIMGDDAKAKSQLFSGAHTRTVNAGNSQKNSALGKFVTKSLKCLGCRAVIKSGSLCGHCAEEQSATIVMTRMQELREKEEEYNRLWTQCQRCQGSLLEPVLCSNRDCDIFYRRAKARLDVQQVEENMRRLTLDLSW